ncbi:MAG: hypothetical protein WA254_04615 [Candidatus Sulfotelmatobacter sp.]
MTWKPELIETPTQRKVNFVLMTVTLVVTWLLLISWLYQNYQWLSVDARYSFILLLIVVPLPWGRTVIEKPKSMATASLAYLIVIFVVLVFRHIPIAH